MKKSIVISGGTGLIGSRIIEMLDKSKYDLRVFTRSPRKAHDNVSYFKWDPMMGEIDLAGLKDCDHILSLAGAGIADKRWTEQRKKLIIESRVKGNELIAASLKEMGHRPTSIVAGSAIGYYGDRGSEELKDDAVAGGKEFLTDSTTQWENALMGLHAHTDQLTIVRIGIVLSTRGGALEKMMIPLRFGISGYFGNGKQYYSWIHIDDVCRMLIKGIEDKNWSGTYNGTAPEPLQLKEMAKQIKNMFLPIAFAAPVPEFLLKIAMGEMTKMLVNSTRAIPSKAQNEGFEYLFVDVGKAVEDLKKRKI